MKAVKWLLSRLAVALILGVIVGLLAYYVIFPAYVAAAYRKNLPLEQFVNQSGAGVAGSQDAVYFGARFDCHDTVTRISGEAPDALYWMIGIYDNHLNRIPGGHLNDTMVEVDEDGQFQVVIQEGPGNGQDTLECGNKRSGLIIMRVFLPEDPGAVTAPSIERVSSR